MSVDLERCPACGSELVFRNEATYCSNPYCTYSPRRSHQVEVGERFVNELFLLVTVFTMAAAAIVVASLLFASTYIFFLPFIFVFPFPFLKRWMRRRRRRPLLKER